MTNCLVCTGKVKQFISFGEQPIANGFINKDQFNDEYFFTMEVGYCESCHMVQLLRQPDREQMFHEEYPFFSSLSNFMTTHFKNEANDLFKQYLNKDSFVVEMGSNDGIFLQNFKDKGMKHLGVEPSRNVAEVASKKGINTISKFFDKDLAQKIIDEYGKVDLFFSANVMCHIPYIHSIAEGVTTLLSDLGVLVFEDPYLGDIVEKTSYDQIYDEHVFFFSAHSVQNTFERHGLELIDVKHLDVHGGSMRYTLAKKGARKISPNVQALIKKEHILGLTKIETFLNFSSNVAKSKKDLVNILEKYKSEGKMVAGYGATSKSTTVMNYCGITPEHISFISDTTPLKQGKFSPGAHIPICSREHFIQNKPDYIVLFAWNHKKEILEKETGFTGKWITYVPEVHKF